MFFDVIKLSRNSWHYRLQSFLFGEPPYLDNFCPYFWLSIFCLMISPFVGLFIGCRKIYFFCVSILEKLLSPVYNVADFIQENICEPFLASRYRGLSDAKIYYLFDKAYMYKNSLTSGYGDLKVGNKCAKEFEIWKKAMGETWEEYLAGVKKRVQKRKDEEWKRQDEYEEKLRKRKEVKLKKEQLRKKMFSKIAQYTKWVAIPIGLILAIVVVGGILFFLGWGCSFIVKSLISFWTWKVTGVMFGITLGLLTLIGIAFILAKLGKKLKACLSFLFIPEPKPLKPKRLKKAIDLEDLIIAFLEKLILPFQIFIVYVKIFKQNNCPAILWEEEEK